MLDQTPSENALAAEVSADINRCLHLPKWHSWTQIPYAIGVSGNPLSIIADSNMGLGESRSGIIQRTRACGGN